MNIVVSRVRVLIPSLEVAVAGLHYTVWRCGAAAATLPSVPQQPQLVPGGAPADRICPDLPGAALASLQWRWGALAQRGQVAPSPLPIILYSSCFCDG